MIYFPKYNNQEQKVIEYMKQINFKEKIFLAIKTDLEVNGEVQ